jgi:hypothetical protein
VVACRNCHRKRELRRDLAGLTKNGQHDTSESGAEEMLKYLLLMAEHLDTTVEAMKSDVVPANLITPVQASAASLRRKAASLTPRPAKLR